MQLSLTNKDGQVLNLLSTQKFILKAAENLHGVETDIATSESPYMDGANIEMVKTLPRGIELTFKVLSPVDQNLAYMTSFIKSKQYVTLTQIENNQQIVIKGIATLTPYTRMSGAVEIVVQVYCGQPYWEDATAVVDALSRAIPLLYFPVAGQYFTPVGRPFGVVDTDLAKTFTNDGDTAVGMNIRIVALNNVVNPRISCSTGEQEGNYMQFNITMTAADELEINTVKGNKYILLNGQNTYNGTPLLNYLQFSGNDWLQLETGDNVFNLTAASGADSIYFTATYKRRYE